MNLVVDLLFILGSLPLVGFIGWCVVHLLVDDDCFSTDAEACDDCMCCGIGDRLADPETVDVEVTCEICGRYAELGGE